MPVTPNSLLQAAAQAKTQAAANSTAPTAEPGDKASSFAQVYAKQAENKPVAAADGPAKPARRMLASISLTVVLPLEPVTAASGPR